MKNNKLLCKFFFILALIQLAVPLYMVWHWEDILQNGKQYTWLTAPVDPYDAFRGRYIDLRFKDMKGPILSKAQLNSGQTAYAMITEDQKGYAFISSISDSRPEGDVNSYIKIKVSYIQDDNMAHFVLPFKRYYMQEGLAPRAEQAYRSNAGTEAMVSVRVKNGYGVVEELYIGDKTIYEYLRKGE